MKFQPEVSQPEEHTMSYKTILVNAELSQRAEHIVTCAARIAAAEQAHLIGLASTGINPLVYQCNAAAPGVPLLPEDLSGFIASAERALTEFEIIAMRHGAPSCERRITDDGLPDSLVLSARYCDLVVVGQSDPDAHAPPSSVPYPQELVLHSPRPVLVIPWAGRFEHIGRRVLVGWDGGIAASRAILAALPLLRRAQLVTLAVLNPDLDYGAHGAQPGADMAQYLARHGVNVEVMTRETERGEGDHLLSLAADTDADLLVMGCYGHSRFRELVLGGATRTVLKTMALPVLMAH
jgi:nucleotide-binding universal stress UspA family protein